MKITGFIQARLGSTRLAKKMLLKLGDYTILEWVLQRVKKSKELDSVVLLLPDSSENDVLEEVALSLGIPVFRGSEKNVLERFYLASQKYPSDAYARICADNPFICFNEIDRVLSFFKEQNFDYSFNHVPKLNNNYADGFGCEVFSQKTLAKVYKAAHSDSQREHVTSYIWENMKDFTIGTLNAPIGLAYPELQFDVDTAEDLQKLNTFVHQIAVDTKAEKIIQIFTEFKL